MSSISLRLGDLDANMSLIGPSFDIFDVFEMSRDPDDDIFRVVLLVDLTVKVGFFVVKADTSFKRFDDTKADRNNTKYIDCFIIFFRTLI